MIIALFPHGLPWKGENMQNKNKNPRIGLPIAILGFGTLSLLLFFGLTKTGKLPSAVCLALSLFVFFAASGVYARLSRDAARDADAKFGRSLGQIMLEIVIKMRLPMVICDTAGKIIWRNRAFGEATEAIGSVMGVGLDTISTLSLDALSEDAQSDAELCDRLYRVDAFGFKTDEKNYWFLVFNDRTEYEKLTEMVESERSVIAYILIDNLDELSRHVQDFGSEVNDIAGILRDFAAELDAVLREYERNKYLLITNRAGLNRCIASSFSILDRVREVRIGDMGLPVTISMGISDVGATLRDREAGAREALGMALARGGDQVVYKNDDGLRFYGGTTRPVQKRSSVAAKVRSCELVAHISRASSVLIMGHSGADQDCFGAAVGIARLAMFCFVKPYIVVDKTDANTQNFLAKFKNIPEYGDTFVTPDDAQELIASDTLLVIVDVNNIDHMLSPGIALSVNDAIIIDHHRKTAPKTQREWIAEYIEPSASSASELVAEILEQSISEGLLLREEADALLGGILLDTKQFTRSTGTRTLNAAIYLRSAGASVYESACELKSDFCEFRKQSKILSDLVIYRGRFAIAKDEDDGAPTDRIAAAKAAESLLSIKGVDAAFALIRIGGETHISARSGAAVSVQLILEKMGGGGHLDSAGARSADPMVTVLEQLKAAIDAYIEENSAPTGTEI